MDRSREARRGSMASTAAVNGGTGRRRPRLRDSPEEDGGLETAETGRLRERNGRKDRDRDRDRSRGGSKRRRGERILHGSGRDEVGDTSDESGDEDDDENDDDDSAVPVRLPTTASSSSLPPNHHRKSFPAKLVRAPAVWKVADEMIGVSIPRKARSASCKRSHECSISGSGGGGDTVHRQTPSTSPARPSPAPMSPSSSNHTAVRKKMKPMSASKHRPPKTVKSPPPAQDISCTEFEVAEVLFGMTRQPSKPESKEPNGSTNDVAAKRKRPRPTSNEEGSSTSQPSQVAAPAPISAPTTKLDSNMTEKILAVENGSAAHDSHLPRSGTIQQEPPEPEAAPELNGSDRCDKTEVKVPAVELDRTTTLPADKSKGEKFKFDLMVPASVKSSSEMETEVATDLKPLLMDGPSKRSEIRKTEEERSERITKMEMPETLGESTKVEKNAQQDFETKEPIAKERMLELQLDIEKPGEDVRHPKQQQPQQSKTPRAEAKQEKGQPTSIPLPMAFAGWPGGLPPLGYMGQVPALQAAGFPMDGSNGASKAMQPPHFPSLQMRPKRCATHCYIAQNIYYHQQMARLNPFWATTPGAMPLLGTKPYNLNSVPPPSESILVNPMQGGFPGRTVGSGPEKLSGQAAAAFPGHSSKDKNSVANTFLDASQRKPLVLQQAPQGGPTSNMLHAPTFIIPLNQPQAAAAATARSGSTKSGTGAASAPPANSSSLATMTSASSAPAVSFNYANLPANEAQYLAILQSNGYPFPIPAHVGASPQYRAGNPAQAVPFFNGSFYTSPMMHQSQIQAPQSHAAQQGHQNPSTSSGSTSSQKQQQQLQRLPTTGAPGSTGGGSHGLPTSKPRQQHLLPHPARQLEAEVGSEESPSTAESRVSHAQKGIHPPNFNMSMHPQDYAMMSHAAAVRSGGASHGDKQHPAHSQQHNVKIDLTPSQAFAMSFASFNGAAAAAAAATVPPPGLDFSSITHNHPVFQNLQNIPEAARHGYQVFAAAAAAQQQQQQQQKKGHHMEDGKTAIADSGNATAPGEDERKMSSKAGGGFAQQSLSFSRSDTGDASMATILNNSVVDSSARTLNLISGARPSSHAPSSAPSTTGAPPAASSNTSHPHLNQQQMMQLQQFRKQQQHQQIQLQQSQLAARSKSVSSTTNVSIYSDRLPTGSMVTKFPNAALGGFPQTLIQGGTPNQSGQWGKNSTQSTMVVMPSAAPTTAPNSMKNQFPQQGRASQPSLTGHHQMQISFASSNTQKAPTSGQPLTGLASGPSLGSAASAVVGSPQGSISKNASGSPRATSGAKPATTSPLQQQSSKNSSSGPSRKSSPVSNRNSPSILGNPHNAPASHNSNNKQQQPQHKFPQSQLFYPNAYMQGQSPQVNAAAAAAAAGYYQRRPSDQQQQPSSNSTSTSNNSLSLCPPTLSLTSSNTSSDPAKAVAAATASNMKALQPAALLQSAAGAPGSTHPLMSSTGFSYIHAVPSMSAKPAEQKSSAGNENLHGCWQQEKR